MAVEIAGAVHSIRLLMDVIKANKTLANYNELVAAVSEVNAELISAQAATIASHKSEMALTEQVRELKQKIMALENWEREAECYQLYAAPLGTYTYRLKFGVKPGETLHYLCTNCFTDRKKSILQFDVGGHSVKKKCPRCKDEVWITMEDFVGCFPAGSR